MTSCSSPSWSRGPPSSAPSMARTPLYDDKLERACDVYRAAKDIGAVETQLMAAGKKTKALRTIVAILREASFDAAGDTIATRSKGAAGENTAGKEAGESNEGGAGGAVVEMGDDAGVPGGQGDLASANAFFLPESSGQMTISLPRLFRPRVPVGGSSGSASRRLKCCDS